MGLPCQRPEQEMHRLNCIADERHFCKLSMSVAGVVAAAWMGAQCEFGATTVKVEEAHMRVL